MVTQKSPYVHYRSSTSSNESSVQSAATVSGSSEATRPPKTIDEYLVGQMEIDSGCTTEAVIPPPESCPGYVQTAGSLASLHFATLVVVFGFMVILLEMTMFIFRDK